jgi:hypothetical protein
MWGTLDVTEWQLVVERFVDDGADYRFVPDRPSDNEVRAEMSLLVALGPGLPGAGLAAVTRLRELLALVRDDICPRLFPYLERAPVVQPRGVAQLSRALSLSLSRGSVSCLADVGYGNNSGDLRFHCLCCSAPCRLSGRGVADLGTRVGVTWNACADPCLRRAAVMRPSP